MPNLRSAEVSDDTRYYAFALATTTRACAELRAMLLSRLVDAVRAEAAERPACRDTDVMAATRLRPWRV
jgi:hypothetical protein